MNAKVTCTNPAPGISGAVFQTYPSLRALYAAYTAKVAALDSGAFRQNFGDCGTHGEVGWTHSFQHTKAYTVGQMESGAVTDGQAAGRVFCNFTQGVEHIAWTQDDGRLLAYAAGPVHQDVYSWWVAIHHNIGLGRAPVNVTTSPGAGA